MSWLDLSTMGIAGGAGLALLALGAVLMLRR
jgi:hypothetical protein